MDRREFASLTLVVLVLVAGIVVLTDRSAKRRALAHEESYLQSQLENASCVIAYSTSEILIDERASVIDHRLDGRMVRVVHPYSYTANQIEADNSTVKIEADSSSEAVYLVSGDTVRRVQGETPDPC